MYDTEQNEQNRRREQSLYRAAFAGVHASESLKREDFYMKHNKPARVRVGRLAFTCMLLAALLCMMSMMAYAATDGETANPVTAVRIYIDGQEATGQLTKQADGSYQLQYGEEADGAQVEIELAPEEAWPEDCTEGGLEFRIETEAEGESQDEGVDRA